MMEPFAQSNDTSLREALTAAPDSLSNLLALGEKERRDNQLCMKLHQWAVAVEGGRHTLLLLQTARVTMDTISIDAGARYVVMAIARDGVSREIAIQVLDVMRRDPSGGDRVLKVFKCLTLLYPDVCDAVSALAAAVYETGHFDRARKWIARALALNIGDIENRLRLGYIYESLNERPAALETYTVAARMAQGAASTIDFLSGWYARGGDGVEASRLLYERARRSGHAVEPGEFKAMLLSDSAAEPFIRFEHGEIALCIHHLANLGRIAGDRPLSIACNPRLHGFLSQSFPQWRFVASQADLNVKAVAHEAVPHLVESLGGNSGPATSLKPSWSKSTLGENGTLSVGITWRSSLRLSPQSFGADPKTVREDLSRQLCGNFDARRSLWRKIVPLSAFQPFLDDPRFKLVSIQYGVSEVEKQLISEAFSGAIRHLDVDFAGDFDAIASAVCSLDAVVAIPNSHAHLAAALGMPTHVLLHETPVPLWADTVGTRVYRKVTTHQKPLRQEADGRSMFHYSGRWLETVDAARRAILKQAGFR